MPLSLWQKIRRLPELIRERELTKRYKGGKNRTESFFSSAYVGSLR